MQAKPARDAMKRGLGFSVFRGRMPAPGTPLARIPRRDKKKHPPGPAGLVVQQGPEGPPPLAKNRPVEPRLLPDVLPRGFFRPPGRSGHALDFQVFENDDRVVFADRCRDLVEEVESRVRDLSVQDREFLPGLGPVLRALLLPGQGPLKTLDLFLFLSEIERVEDRSVREGGEPGHPEIDPDQAGIRVGGHLDLPLRLDCDEPFLSGSSDRHVLDRSQDGSALSVSDPPHLGEPDPGVRFVQFDPLGKPERIVPSPLVEDGPERALFKKVLVGTIEIFEGLLEDLGRNAGEPGSLGGFLPDRKKIGRADEAQAFLAGFVPGNFEGKRPVVDEPGRSGTLPEKDFLVGVRSQSEPESLDLFHRVMIP